MKTFNKKTRVYEIGIYIIAIILKSRIVGEKFRMLVSNDFNHFYFNGRIFLKLFYYTYWVLKLLEHFR